MTKILDKLIEYSFYFLLFLTPLVFTTATSELFEVPKMFLVYTFSVFLFGAWLTKNFLEQKIQIPKNPFLIPLIFFLIANITSTITSIDLSTSILGYPTRLNGGLLSTLAYLSLFLVFIANFDRAKAKTALFVIVFSALLVSVWGIPSHFGYDPNCFVLQGRLISACWQEEFNPTLRIFSTLGQPNWLGAYLAMILPLSLSFLLVFKKTLLRLFFFSSSILIFWAILLTNSRAAIFGLFIALLVFGFFLLRSKEILKKNWQALSVLSLIFAILIIFFGQFLFGRFSEALQTLKTPPQQEIQSEKKEITPPPQVGGTESGEIRQIVWQGAIDIFRNWPILGSGVETFAYSYYQFRPLEHNQTTEWNFLYNKAHNEFLNYLATTGIVGFSSYLLLIVVFLFYTTRYLTSSQNREPRTENRELIILGLKSGFIAYLVQNFFSFSVVATALLFFLYPATSVVLIKKSDQDWNLSLKKISQFLPSHWVLPIASVFFTLFALIFVAKMFFANTYFTKAQDSYLPEISHFYLEKAVFLNPYSPSIYFSDLSFEASQIANSLKNEVGQQEFMIQAQNFAENAVKRSPKNLSIARKVSQTYLQLSQIDPEFAKLALSEAKRAVELAPTEPQILLDLATTQRFLGNNQKALETLEKVLELKPDFIEAQEKHNEWQKK